MTAFTRPAASAQLIVILGLLTGVTPLATDMYLAAFPAMATELATPAASIQLTLTAFMLGLAIGQFVIGPLSDQWGRKKPLLIGTVICTVSAVVAALAPSIQVLIAARLVMGLAGAAGVVIARSIIIDITSGAQTAKLMNLMMIINGVAPVIAPTVGGIILAFADWRVIFWVLTALLALLSIAVALLVPESLDPARRVSGGLKAVAGSMGTLVTSRRYMGFMLAFVFAFGTMFAYISGSTFALQNILGMSETGYSLVFALNSLGVMIASAAAGKLLDKFTPRGMGTVGVFALLVFALIFLGMALTGLKFLPTLLVLFLLASSMGLILGNLTTLALSEMAKVGGAASALLGSLQFALAGAVSPLVSLAGEASAVPMGITMTVCAVLAVALLLTTPRLPKDSQLLGSQGH